MNQGCFRFLWVAVALAALGLCSPASATTVGFGASAAGSCVAFPYIGLGDLNPSYITCYQAGGDGFASALGSGAFGPGFAGGPNFSTADLSAGTLSATATWSTQNFTTNGGALETGGNSAGAVLRDTVTFTSAPPGGMATLELDTGLTTTSDGGLQATAVISAQQGSTSYAASETAEKGYATGFTYTDGDGNPLPGWGVLTITFPIVLDVPYSVLTDVGALVQTPALDSPFYPLSGVVFGGISVDPNWTLSVPPGTTYTTASGFPIGGSGPVAATTPEPASIALPGLGLAMLAVRRRRRNHP